MSRQEVNTAPPPPKEQASSGGSTAQTAPPRQRGMTCAPCRLRRVKCERQPGSMEGCIKCIAKGIQCSPMPARETTKRTLNRSGPRLELAKAIYGQTMPAGPSAVSHRMATSEVEDALMMVLMDQWFSLTPHYHRDTRPIYKAFMSAGKRMNRISATHQTLCYAAMALMARTTDHPLVIGYGAPTVTALAEGGNFGDLSEYGHRREDACRALLVKATEAVDTSGAFRHPSSETITSLLIMEILTNPHVRPSGMAAARAFTSGYVHHTKELVESQAMEPHADTPDLNLSLCWTAFFRDALLSAATGHSLSFMPEDMLRLREAHSRTVLSITDAIAIPRPGNALDSLRMMFDAFIGTIAETFMAMSDHLTGYLAQRRKELNDTAVKGILELLDHGAIAVHELAVRFGIFRSNPEARWEALDRHLRDMRATRCLQCFSVLDVLQARLDLWSRTESKPSSIFELPRDSLRGSDYDEGHEGHDEQDMAYGARLVTLHSHAKAIVFSAALEMIAVLQDMSGQKAVGGPHWLDPRAQNLVFEKVPLWSGVIIETATAEEGGPLLFTFAEKLRCLTVIKTALNSIGWSYPQLASPMSWISEELLKLEAHRQVFEFTQQCRDLLSLPLAGELGQASDWDTVSNPQPLPIHDLDLVTDLWH